MNVLVGFEGGDESMKTLRATIERTQAVGDELTIGIIEKPGTERVREESFEMARGLIDEAGVEATLEHLEGDPASALVEYAERGGFDQLVIGGGTESPMGKIRLGPITEFILLNSTTTVKLVR